LFETLKKLTWTIKYSNICLPYIFFFELWFYTLALVKYNHTCNICQIKYEVSTLYFTFCFDVKYFFLWSGNCPYGVDLAKNLVVMLQNVLWSCGTIRISFSRRTPEKVYGIKNYAICNNLFAFSVDRLGVVITYNPCWLLPWLWSWLVICL
jgi:hypothetical protein